MKNILTIQDSLQNKISYYHLAAFLVLLPFDRFYSQLVLASFILHTLIHLNKQRFHKAFNIQNLVLSSVFLLNIAGEKRLLKEEYFENKLYNSYLNEFNAHNQYLSILLKTGVAGLIVYLLTLLYGVKAT